MGIKNVPEVNPAPGEASREEVVENLRELCRCGLRTAQKACGTCDSRGRLSLRGCE